MHLLVGLGNPGAKYARNRHNIGFMAVDAIAEAHGIGPFRAKFRGELADGRIGSHRVLLLKPQTYMNESGRSVGEAMRFHKLAPEDVTVLHDELDLAPGKCRVKQGGGHAGHNGLRSIHAQIGEGYRRLRLGIGHPGHKDRVSGYVLHDFPKADEAWLDDLMRAVGRHAGLLLDGDNGAFLGALAEATAASLPEKPKAGGPASRPVGETAGPAGEAEASPAAKPAALPATSPFERLAGLFRKP